MNPKNTDNLDVFLTALPLQELSKLTSPKSVKEIQKKIRAIAEKKRAEKISAVSEKVLELLKGEGFSSVDDFCASFLKAKRTTKAVRPKVKKSVDAKKQTSE
jgi:hypothetical protein